MSNFIFLLYLINTLYFKRTLNVSFFLGAGLFSWKKRRFGGHCAALNNYEKEVVTRSGQTLLSSNKRENGLKLYQEKFMLDIRKNFSMVFIVKHWKRLPKEVDG